MNYKVSIEILNKKEFLAIKGYMSFKEITPDKNADWERLYGYANKELIEELKIRSGTKDVYQIFCNTCRNDKQFGFVCSDDLACENINNAQASDGFEIICLAPSEYLKIDYHYGSEITIEQAFKEIDNYFWNEWISKNPYISKIDAEFADNPETADITLYDEENKRVTAWYPIKHKHTEVFLNT